VVNYYPHKILLVTQFRMGCVRKMSVFKAKACRGYTDMKLRE